MKHIRVFLSLITLVLAVATILSSCKVDTSLEQFYARVKLEYILEDSTLYLKEIDIQELWFNDGLISIGGKFTPKFDKEGYTRVTKSDYGIEVLAKVKYIDKEGKEGNHLFYNEDRAFSIMKDGIIKIVLKKRVK